MKGAVVNKTKSTFSSSSLTDDNMFVFDPEVGGVTSVFTRAGNGLVPAPNGSGAIKYLREDGTWVTPPDTNTVYTHPTGDGNKHVTMNGTTNGGRVLTASTIAGVYNWEIPSLYNHPSKAWANKTTLANAEVISNFTIDSLGHPTNWSTRTLTPANIGAEPSFSKLPAFNRNFAGSGVATTVARSDHNHNKPIQTFSDSNINMGFSNNAINRDSWNNFTGVNITIQLSSWLVGQEAEGSYTGSDKLTIQGISGTTLLVPDGLLPQIPPNGVFGVKFISATVGVLFGTLIPV